MRKEVSAVTQTYDLALWLLPHVSKFPRSHRFTLGDRLETGVLDLLEILVTASYTRDKRELLRRANLRLERLRYLMRLSKDLNLFTVRQYEFASKAILTIGSEIGGWEKQQAKREDGL